MALHGRRKPSVLRFSFLTPLPLSSTGRGEGLKIEVGAEAASGATDMVINEGPNEMELTWWRGMK